jgi:zinc protease
MNPSAEFTASTPASRTASRFLALALFLLTAMAWSQGKPASGAAASTSTTLKTPPSAQKPARQAPKKTAAPAPRMFLLPSSSPLYAVKIMVMAGSVDDPAGKEGLANLVSQALIEGGFGDPKHPVTKEKLAEITRPWGSAAMPSVRVDKQTTTFSMLVPKDAFPQFVRSVLQPMFSRPLFQQKEIDRLRTDALNEIQSKLRFEEQELLGLQALESYVFQGTALSAPAYGTVQGLKAVERADIIKFYRTFYTAHDVAIATSATPESAKLLRTALPLGAKPPQQLCNCDVQTPEGRQVLIITLSNAIATGIHLGFPLDVQRGTPDYWPLFIANTYLGAHRDEFGRLFQEIREARGYNYGDYSYIEYVANAPYDLFPPPDTPRSQQYFSLWVRPIGHQYAHFIMKAVTAELDRFAREGMTPQQVEETKIKARTLYLKYAENVDRQLGYRLDDAFYGMDNHGYLAEMLKNIDAVNADTVNAVIHRYLQARNLRYVITTNESDAGQLADDIAGNTNCTPKSAAGYHLADPPTEAQRELLDQDQEWIAYHLNIQRSDIYIVKAGQMFETASLPGMPPVAAAPAAGAGK